MQKHTVMNKFSEENKALDMVTSLLMHSAFSLTEMTVCKTAVPSKNQIVEFTKQSDT